MLIDRLGQYQTAAKQLIRQRYQMLYRSMGVTAKFEPDDVNCYSLIDLPELGGQLYGADFEAWFIEQDLGTKFLFLLAGETGVVLLPGNGFEVVDTSARVSLANLTDHKYRAIGVATRRIVDECHDAFVLASA